jgi:hypothetical protein
MRGERTFVDFTGDTLRLFSEASGFAAKECGITHDIRPGRGDEMWVNAIGEKK